MMKKATFREDLYYRISSFHIHAPSLRDMPEDIPLIARHLISNLNQEIGEAPDRYLRQCHGNAEDVQMAG